MTQLKPWVGSRLLILLGADKTDHNEQDSHQGS